MSKLEQRVGDLEKKCGNGDGIVWVIRWVNAENKDARISRLSGDGRVWTALQDETEDQFIARASAEVGRSAWGNASLFAG